MDLKSMVFGTTFSRDFMRKVDAHSTSILVALKAIRKYLKIQNGIRTKMESHLIFLSQNILYRGFRRTLFSL